MKTYFLLGYQACSVYHTNIDKLKEEAIKNDITSFGDVICYDTDIMTISELLDIAILRGEYIEISEKEYLDLSKFWLDNY